MADQVVQSFTIERSGIETFFFTFAGAPGDAGPMRATPDDGDTWVDMAWNGSKTVASLVIAHPDAPAGDLANAGLVLGYGRTTLLLGLFDTPERVIRGEVIFYAAPRKAA